MEWHPFAEKFPLLEGDEFEAFKKSIQQTKGNEQPIAYRLVKGKEQGLDGRNRARACSELKIKCNKKLVALKDDQVKDFIARRNIHRRHMTKEMRQAIVAELHADGESARQIADVVGVSHPTVLKDIAESGGKFLPPENETPPNNHSETNGSPEKVTGRDGKEYPATKPKILCERCARNVRTGRAIVEPCQMCKEARQGARTPKPPKNPTEPTEHVDAFGTPLPKRCKDAYCDPWIQKAIDFLGTTSAAFWGERLADGLSKRKRHYPHFNVKDFVDGVAMAGNTLDQLLEHLKEKRPAGVCPPCEGAGCPDCKQSGLVPRAEYAKLKKILGAKK